VLWGGLRQAKAPQRPGFRKHCCRPGTEGSRTFENNGVAAFAVSEDNTSRECAYYGCEVVRKPMGAGNMPPWAHIAQRRERCPEHHAARAGGAGHKGRVARAHHCGELHSNSVEDDTHNPSKRRVTRWRALRQKKCSNQKFKGGIILSFTQDE
jgi:hypothetical protein